MRQYLYLFWGLVLAGMIILTAACPECRQAATMQDLKSNNYYVYDSNGDRLTGGSISASGSISAGRAADGQKF